MSSSGIYILKIVIVAIVSYFLGNISPATLIAKAKGYDIRKEGSGNPGTTNMLRTVGKGAAAGTLIIDIIKGALAVLLGYLMGGEALPYVAGLAVIIGHMWPAAYGFKGGKGVATTAGVMLMISWPAALICMGVAALTVLITRRMSLGSMFGAIAVPITGWFFFRPHVLWGLVITILILYRHKTNIGRIFRGEEPKLGEKSSGKQNN